MAQANRIANVLVSDYGFVPGERVILRSGNHPMLIAAWLAVLKAGGVAITTMPVLRERELVYMIGKAKVRFAISQASSPKTSTGPGPAPRISNTSSISATTARMPRKGDDGETRHVQQRRHGG